MLTRNSKLLCHSLNADNFATLIIAPIAHLRNGCTFARLAQSYYSIKIFGVSSKDKRLEATIFNPDWGIGQFIAYHRKKFGIKSQAEFAKSIGVSRFYLSNIESGRTPLKLKTAWKICQKLSFHPDFLISRGSNILGSISFENDTAASRAESLINAFQKSNFMEVWPALRESVFEDQEPLPDAEIKMEVDTITGYSNTPAVKSEIERLVARLKRATAQPGKKAELARFMDVQPPRVSEWLSGQEPGGEYALRLLKWVEQQERQNKKP